MKPSDRQEKIEKRNQDGDMPSNIPSEKLKNPPDKDRPKDPNRDPGKNSTAKDPNLGGRNPKGR